VGDDQIPRAAVDKLSAIALLVVRAGVGCRCKVYAPSVCAVPTKGTTQHARAFERD
jgi:hypothetical protein